MKTIFTLVMIYAMLQPPQLPQQSLLPQELPLQQETPSSCTLCASTMMVRNTLYIRGCDKWKDTAEADIAPSAWSVDGLLWNWEYSPGCTSIAVGHKALSGVGEDRLCRVLMDHPEGIVLYCGGDTHHGVFLTRYTEGVFYCADPAVGYAGKEIPLEGSLLGVRLGNQSSILSAVTAYWYVENNA